MKKPRQISFLNQEEVVKLLAIPDTTTLAGIRDLAILSTLCSTGLHVTELAALNLSNLDFINQQLIVGGKKGRVISVAVTILMMITGYREFLRTVPEAVVNNQAVFLNYKGNRLSADGICAIIRWYLVQVGFKANGGRCVLRHSFAMGRITQGVSRRELQVSLGLSLRSRTARVYSKLVRQQSANQTAAG